MFLFVTGKIANLPVFFRIKSFNPKMHHFYFQFRVLQVENGNVIFTLKSAQVDSDRCLVNRDQIQRGDKYPGVVVQTKETGAMVVFYNNIRGWINKKQLGSSQVGDKTQLGSSQIADTDPREYFFAGQVVRRCNLLDCSNLLHSFFLGELLDSGQ